MESSPMRIGHTKSCEISGPEHRSSVIVGLRNTQRCDDEPAVDTIMSGDI